MSKLPMWIIITLLSFILIGSTVSLVSEVNSYNDYMHETHQLSDYNYAFEAKDYDRMVYYAYRNKYNEEKPLEDVSQFEAFAFYYEACITYYQNKELNLPTVKYENIMNENIKSISWSFLLDEIEVLNEKYGVK